MVYMSEKRGSYLDHEADLLRYHISLPELLVMVEIEGYAEMGVCVPPARIARETFGTFSGWRDLRREDYEQAIEGLVARGLLQITTEAQCEEWRAARAAEPLPSCEDKEFSWGPGGIFFTSAGSHLYGTIQREVFGCVRLGERMDPDDLTVTIMSESEAAARRRADYILTNYVPYDAPGSPEEHPVDARLKRVVGPTKLGPWRLSRFEVVPSGYEMVLEYE